MDPTVSPLFSDMASLPHGDVVPMPTLPVEVMDVVPVAPKYATLKTASADEVAAAREPLTVGKVNGDVPPPVPQALPVFESVPFEEKVAHPGVPPALETTRLVVEAIVVERMLVVPLASEKLRPLIRPVLSIEKSVEVAVPVVEPIEKSVLLIERVEEAKSERSAEGEEEPMPTLPRVVPRSTLPTEPPATPAEPPLMVTLPPVPTL